MPENPPVILGEGDDELPEELSELVVDEVEDVFELLRDVFLSLSPAPTVRVDAQATSGLT